MLDIFLSTDQSTTCPVCGYRADIIASFYHTLMHAEINQCLNIRC